MAFLRGSSSSAARAEEAAITWGHRVLEVTPGSPAAEAGLVPYLDVVVSVDGEMLDGEERSLAMLMREKENKEASIVVYNTKKRESRTATVRPRRGWGGQGLLGSVVRYDSFYGSLSASGPASRDGPAEFDRVLAVRSVRAGSEADRAGLRASEDLIVGGENMTFTHCAELVSFLAQFAGRDVVLFVYNVPTDTVRQVVFHPTIPEIVRPAIPAGAPVTAGHVKIYGMELVSGPRGARSVEPGFVFEFPDPCRTTVGRGFDPIADAALLSGDSAERVKASGSLMDRAAGSVASPGAAATAATTATPAASGGAGGGSGAADE